MFLAVRFKGRGNFSPAALGEAAGLGVLLRAGVWGEAWLSPLVMTRCVVLGDNRRCSCFYDLDVLWIQKWRVCLPWVLVTVCVCWGEGEWEGALHSAVSISGCDINAGDGC